MQIASIQILRAVAALFVAIVHGQNFIGIPMEKLGQTFGWNFLLPWGAGVDLFFVISGFIMVYSSERLFATRGGARIFIWRRLSRIVPLYWCATIFLLVKMAAQHKPLPDAASIGASFLFLPWDTYQAGAPRPVYDLGWTLNYEMFFYVIFVLCINSSREMAVSLVAASLAAIVALGVAFPSGNPQLYVWTQPIVMEFGFGMALALLVRNGFVLASALRYGLIALGVAVLYYDLLDSGSQSHDWIPPTDFLRVAGWGIPAAMIVAGCVLKGKQSIADNWCLRLGEHLGNASYALYLCHAIVMRVFAAGWFAIGLNYKIPAYVGMAICVLGSVVASLCVHRWFEIPVTRFLQERMRRIGGKPPVGALQASSPKV